MQRINAIKKVIKPKNMPKMPGMAPMPQTYEEEEKYPEIERVNSKSIGDISKSYSFDRSKFIEQHEEQLSETYIEKSEERYQYRYVFYSPSLEVLMRVHNVLQAEINNQPVN